MALIIKKRTPPRIKHKNSQVLLLSFINCKKQHSGLHGREHPVIDGVFSGYIEYTSLKNHIYSGKYLRTKKSCSHTLRTFLQE